MTEKTATQVVCKKGIKRDSNSDLIIIAQRPDIAFIMLIDISTRCPFDTETLQKVVSDSLREEVACHGLDTSTQELVNIVTRIQCDVNQTFTKGAASLLLCAVKESEILGCILGDVRLGQAVWSEQELKNVHWLTPVHTAANPFGQFDDSMKTLPERHTLTRCLKAHRKHEPETFKITTNPRDTVIVASDGFWCDIPKENYSVVLQGMTDTEDDCSALLINVGSIISKPLEISHPNITLI